jgi:hypothetical protein
MKSKASVKKAKGVAKRDLTPRTRVVGGNAVLTNIANMNHESLKAIAQNLRPRWTPQNRPYVDGANPAIGGGAQASEL